MDKNKHDQERTGYDRMILENENKNDSLKQDQRKLEETLSQLQEDLQRGYRTLAMLNEEERGVGGNQAELNQQREDEQEYFFKRQVQGLEESLTESYSSAKKVIEKETEELYRKRGDIPWD